VGQNPAIIELQRVLFQQLTGEAMRIRDDASVTSQLEDLKKQCLGKRWLIVLDDVWDKKHEQQLNCIDPSSTSKLLVTTRIRGLLRGCDEISLNLLAPGESVDLLLRTGQVQLVDTAAKEAARTIAQLCGHLPLYLSICGGVIQGYDGTPDWQEELVEMLRDDRRAVIDEGAGGEDMVAKLVDSSLKMLKDKAASTLFMELGVCPEDVLIQLPVAQLIRSASTTTSSSSKTRDSMSMRRALKTLLDRNLLQGSLANGVQMHDIVRDLVRSRIRGGEDDEDDEDYGVGVGVGIRERQRRVVNSFLAACPADGWKADDPLGKYAAQALQVHMTEALQSDPLRDTEAQQWLDASDDILQNPIVTFAAEAFGHAVLIQLGEGYEAQGWYWEAGKRFGSAAVTSDVSSLGIDEAAASATGKQTTLLMRACDMLMKAEQTMATRTLEVMLQGRITMRLPWNHPDTAKAMERVTALLEEEGGIDIKSPAMLLAIGFAETMSTMVQLGAAPAGEHNIHKPECMEAACPRQLSELLMKAYNLVSRDDPYWMTVALFRLYCAVGNALNCGHRQHKFGREGQARFAPHDLLATCMREYDFKVHHPMMLASPMGLNIQLFNAEATFGLNIYGDIGLTREWLLKVHTHAHTIVCHVVLLALLTRACLRWPSASLVSTGVRDLRRHR
jgi:hypothetical protein